MKDVLLVFGGKSYEHEISVVTASQIYNRTNLEEIKLVPLYVSREGKFFVYTEKKMDVRDFCKSNNFEKCKKFKEVAFVSGENNRLFIKSRLGLKEWILTETAIFACHGSDGENGKLVALFESFGIACSAGRFDALSVCMNKFLFKQVMKGLGVPTIPGFKVDKLIYENHREYYSAKFKFLHFPVILKVNNGGSSIGVFVASSKEEFLSKLNEAFEFDCEVLVENFVENTREFNVAVMGTSDEFAVSEVDEPIKESELLSFADKYRSGKKGSKKSCGKSDCSMVGQTRKFPAEISKNLDSRLKELAGRIFCKLGLSGVVRIDFLFDEKQDKIFVCEVNSIPGSLAYYFFDDCRVSANSLVLKLVDIAHKNFKRTCYFNTEFIADILD